MFFKRWRVTRRGRHGGAALRALHELLGKEPLSGNALIKEATEAAHQDYLSQTFQDVQYDPNFILGFVQAYLYAEVQVRLPRTEVKDVTLEEMVAFSLRPDNEPGEESREGSQR